MPTIIKRDDWSTRYDGGVRIACPRCKQSETFWFNHKLSFNEEGESALDQTKPCSECGFHDTLIFEGLTPANRGVEHLFKVSNPVTAIRRALTRLQELQSTKPTREQALALTKLEEAIHWLEHKPAPVVRGTDNLAKLDAQLTREETKPGRNPNAPGDTMDESRQRP